MHFSGQINSPRERPNAILPLIKSARPLIEGCTGMSSRGLVETESVAFPAAVWCLSQVFISQRARRKYRSAGNLETLFPPLNWLCSTHAPVADGYRAVRSWGPASSFLLFLLPSVLHLHPSPPTLSSPSAPCGAAGVGERCPQDRQPGVLLGSRCSTCSRREPQLWEDDFWPFTKMNRRHLDSLEPS